MLNEIDTSEQTRTSVAPSPAHAGRPPSAKVNENHAERFDERH
jgi:hypothetical protein